VRFLAEFDLIDRGQARLVLARRLPAGVTGERERPKCLDEQALARLICAAEATVARDPLQGRRDVAIVRVLADAGLRCEELAALERRDFLPKRKGARLAVAHPQRAQLPNAARRAASIGGLRATTASTAKSPYSSTSPPAR
jgi:site-specific recombinase XerC